MQRPSGDPRDIVPRLRDYVMGMMRGGETDDPGSEGRAGGGVIFQSRMGGLVRGRRAIAAAAEAFMQQMRAPLPAGGGGPPNDIPPDVAKILRMHLEKIEKNTESVVDVAKQLVISVRSAVNSSVRNEVHMKRIEDRVHSIEAKVDDAIRSGKEAIDFFKQSQLLTEERYASLKSTLDSVIKELKSNRKVKSSDATEKTWFQPYGEACENFDSATKFPDQVMEQVGRVVRYATAIELLLRWLGSPNCEEISQVTCNLQELKETCNDISLIDGTYSEIGRKASDLLYQYYVPGVTALLMADASDGAIINTSTKNELLVDVTFNSKATLDNSLMEITLNVRDLYFPFVKGSLTAPLPWRSAEAHLDLLHDYGAMHAKLDLYSPPILDLSCLFGVKSFCFGGEFAVNKSGTFSKYNGGISVTHNDFCISLKLQDKCQKVSASLFGKLPMFSFALEYVHDLSEKLTQKKKKQHKIVAGISRNLNPSTEVKAFLDTEYFAGGAIQHRWRPNSAVALSCKFNMKEKKEDYPQFGLSMEFGLKSR